MFDQPSSTPATAAGSAPRIVAGTLSDADLSKATRRAVTRALAEDLGELGDVTSRATIPAALVGEAEVVAREAGTVSGLGAMVEAFAAVDARIKVELHADNGSSVIADQVIATVTGPVRGILAAERTALNFLGHLSGIATATAEMQAIIEGTGCQIRDTRKTTPGLRLLEKAAVRDGGGGNHRIGLDDAVLVKDNHLLAAGGVANAIASLRAKNPGLAVQVEVENIDQLHELLELGVTDVLLDNFTPDQVRHAVARVDGRASLEASGNLDASTVRAYAEALGEGGRLAIGAITHSAPQFDVALDMVSTESRALVRTASAAVTRPDMVDQALTTPALAVPAAEVQEAPEGLLDAPAPTGSPVSDDEPQADGESDREGSPEEAHEDQGADADAAGELPRKRRRISSFFSSNEDDPTGQFDVQSPAPTELDGADEPAVVEPPVTELADLPSDDLSEAAADEDDDPVVVVEPPSSSPEPAGLFDQAPNAAGSATDDRELAPLEPLAPLDPLPQVEEMELDELPTMDKAAIEDAEVDGAPFSWRQSPFRQRRED